jgi:dienelactone hydrolase
MKNNYKIFSALLLLFLSVSAFAQDSSSLSLKRINPAVEAYHSINHFSGQFKNATMGFAFSKKDSGTSFSDWQHGLLAQLRIVLGLTVIESQLSDYTPRAIMRSAEDMGKYIRQRWLIWTEPTVPLPMVILIPKTNTQKKLPLVITPHGHGQNPEQYAGIYANDEERKFAEDTERDVAVQAVHEGYIAIAPTTRAFGETRTEEDKQNNKSFSCRIQLMHDLLVGRTPIGDRVWDMSRIIDWAIANLPINKDKIAITGNSGGGTVALFAAACDRRISVAAPSSYFCTFSGSIGSVAHCDCNYIPGILNLGEMHDIAGLIAPRPLCLINGRQDNIFPITETRKAYAGLVKIFESVNAENKLNLYEGDGGHRYYKKGSWPFIKKHFSVQ